MTNDNSFSYADREMSWLSFNERVLQEAEDASVPLFERINFLAIYSSNMDEYFRVRVASLRNLLHLSEKSRSALEFKPARLLTSIQKTVERHHDRGARLWSEHILPELRAHDIHLVDERTVTSELRELLQHYFDREVRPHLEPVHLNPDREAPFLKNQQLYLVVELFPKRSTVPIFAGSPDVALVNIPTEYAPRFKVIATAAGKQYVVFLDDVIRLNLHRLYPDVHTGEAYSITLSREIGRAHV